MDVDVQILNNSPSVLRESKINHMPLCTVERVGYSTLLTNKGFPITTCNYPVNVLDSVVPHLIISSRTNILLKEDFEGIDQNGIVTVPTLDGGAAKKTFRCGLCLTDNIIVNPMINDIIASIGDSKLISYHLDWEIESPKATLIDYEYLNGSGLSSTRFKGISTSTSNAPTEPESNVVAASLESINTSESRSKSFRNIKTNLEVCTNATVSLVDSPEAKSRDIGRSARSELKWKFQPKKPGNTLENCPYSITSDTSGVQIIQSHGMASANREITTRLRYLCRDRREEQIKLSVKVGFNEDGSGKKVIWQVTCMGEDLTSFTANFYQGPQIAQVQFDYVKGSWSSEIVPLKASTDTSLPLELASNRRTIVEIEVEHELPVVLPVKIELTDTNDSPLQKEADDELGDRESGFMTNYLSRTVFVMDSLDLSNNTMRLIVDSEQKHPELNEDNNRIAFELEEIVTDSTPSFTFRLVPLKTAEGVPELCQPMESTDAEDAANKDTPELCGPIVPANCAQTAYTLLRPVLELMPIGSCEVHIESELDVSDRSWTRRNYEQNARGILDELREKWVTERDHHSDFYLGVVKQPANIDICGISDVGRNVSVTALHAGNCQRDAIAHEFGHNLSLQHAPGCGTDDQATSQLEHLDEDFPYPDGSIGQERGWFPRQLKVAGPEGVEIDGIRHRYFDVMSYCPHTFITRYSYNKAIDHWLGRHDKAMAAIAPNPYAVEFGLDESRSIALLGSIDRRDHWMLDTIKITNNPALQFNRFPAEYKLLIEHTPSGTILHREPIEKIESSLHTNDSWSWVARIPYFSESDLQVHLVDASQQVLLSFALIH